MTVAIASIYAYGWGYAAVYSHDLLMHVEAYASTSYDEIRGFHSVAIGLFWSVLLITPLMLIYRATSWAAPAMFAIFGYVYIYIFRAIQRDIPLPHSLTWAFEELQSFLAMAGVTLSPLLAYLALKPLLNKFRQSDAQKAARRC